MSLIINTVTSASTQISYNYLDTSKLFGYEVVSDYTVDFSDISFTDGDGVLWEGINALKEAYLRKNLVARIGTDEFINGRVTNLSFGSSAMVGANEAKITIEESKRLSSYSNNVFAQNIASPQWLSSFVETYSFARSEDTYSYTRNISIQYKQDAGDQFLNNARFFLKNFYFSNRPNFGYQIDGISENARVDSGFKPLITESYDLIGLSVSLTENFESSKVVGNYSKKQTYTQSVLESGYIEKKYVVEIKALKEPLESVANSACAALVDSLIASNSNLGKPVAIEKGINKDGGIISLSIDFMNDPSRNQTQTLTYSCSKTLRGYFYDYSLDMDFAADGKTEIEKFNNAKLYWSSSNGGLTSKILFLFPSAGTLYDLSASVSFDMYNGKIKQTTVYTDDIAYNSAALPAGILKKKTTTVKKGATERINIIADISDKTEKASIGSGSSLAEGSTTVEVVAKKSKGIFFGSDYLNGLSLSGGNYVTSDATSLDTSAGSSSRVISYVSV